MAFTGFLAMIVGIGYSLYVGRNRAFLLPRLHDAAIIDLEPGLCEKIISETRWKWLFLILPFVFFVITFILYWKIFKSFKPFSAFWLASYFCAFLAGLRAAKHVGHGLIGGLVKKYDVPFRLTIEHPDRAGGTAQIGRFYFMQASVLVIPVVWMLAWILLLRDPTMERYLAWQLSMYWFLFVAVIVFVFAFLRPMIAFCRLIRKWKQTHGTCEIDQVRAELLKFRSIPEPTAYERKRRSELAHDLDRLVHLPDWPVSLTISSAFFTTFVAPLLISVVNYLL